MEIENENESGVRNVGAGDCNEQERIAVGYRMVVRYQSGAEGNRDNFCGDILSRHCAYLFCRLVHFFCRVFGNHGDDGGAGAGALFVQY